MCVTVAIGHGSHLWLVGPPYPTVCYGTAAALSEPLLAAFNSSVHDVGCYRNLGVVNRDCLGLLIDQ